MYKSGYGPPLSGFARRLQPSGAVDDLQLPCLYAPAVRSGTGAGREFCGSPRGAYGRWTWIIHGLLWAAFHAFKWWDLVGLLPVCLLIAYISQRTQNNWPALIAHGLFNGLALYLVLTAVLA
jgi:hypothetical protein